MDASRSKRWPLSRARLLLLVLTQKPKALLQKFITTRILGLGSDVDLAPDFVFNTLQPGGTVVAEDGDGATATEFCFFLSVKQGTAFIAPASRRPHASEYIDPKLSKMYLSTHAKKQQ